MSNPICLVGTIATDPRFSQSGSRVPFCSFRLASNDRRYDREKAEWVDGETTWVSVHVFRGLAEHARESFAKGDRVIVSGRLRVRRWEKDERTGISVAVEADALGHDLRWGVSRFERRAGGSAAGGLGGARGEAASLARGGSGWATPATQESPREDGAPAPGADVPGADVPGADAPGTGSERWEEAGVSREASAPDDARAPEYEADAFTPVAA